MILWKWSLSSADQSVMFIEGIQALEQIYFNTLAHGEQLREKQDHVLAISDISQPYRTMIRSCQPGWGSKPGSLA